MNDDGRRRLGSGLGRVFARTKRGRLRRSGRHGDVLPSLLVDEVDVSVVVVPVPDGCVVVSVVVVSVVVVSVVVVVVVDVDVSVGVVVVPVSVVVGALPSPVDVPDVTC